MLSARGEHLDHLRIDSGVSAAAGWLRGSRLRRRRRGGPSPIWSVGSYGLGGIKRLSDSGVIQP